MSANTSIDISELDFETIKTKLKTYLKSQTTFTDYDFEGSGLSTILNILAYNTHYNAYYLNMVANEMFLDTAVKRSSVISHAKMLNYTARSRISPKATIDIKFFNCMQVGLTIPKYTTFYSELIDDKNFIFTTLEQYSGTRVGDNTITIENIELFQGQPLFYNFYVDKTTNPELRFTIPDKNIDTFTLLVIVRENKNSSSYTTFSRIIDGLSLNAETNGYFLQETLDGYYEIVFGDGILGKTLVTGNYITVQYLSTKGYEGNGANKFTLMDNLGSYNSVKITTLTPAAGGKEKESLEEIKFNAPKMYSSKGRAVTVDDYINILSSTSNPVIPIESVNVWGGDTVSNMGKVFIAIKPKGALFVSNLQKRHFIEEVLKPISVVTVLPELVDVDYSYLSFHNNILVDKKKTTLSDSEIKALVKNGIISFCRLNLNKFNSRLILTDLSEYLKTLDESILSVELNTTITKKISPLFTVSNDYIIDFGSQLQYSISDTLTSSLFDYYIQELDLTVKNARLEAESVNLNYISSVTVASTGKNYKTPPTLTVVGNGTGAKVEAIITNGSITSVNIINPGKGYTEAYIVIDKDGKGTGAILTPNLSTNILNVRSVYYTDIGVKKILQPSVGNINISTGILTLTDFVTTGTDDDLGNISLTVYPKSNLLFSGKETIITLDEFNSSSINSTIKNI